MILNPKKTKTNLFLILLFLTHKTISEETPPAEETPPTEETPSDSTTTPSASPESRACNLSVIKELGLTGVESVQTSSLIMCPTIKSTCCQKEDQITLYENWITKKESQNLKDRFSYHESVYTKFLDSIEEIYSRALKLSKKLEEENDPNKINCIIISRRISHYQLSAIINELKSFIKKMHHFWRKSYKGVYCAICDGDANGFFSDDGVVLSKKFCRDIVRHSLTFLVYFHTHVPKLSNLMSKFLVSCDRDGNYKEGGVPKEFFFEVKEDVSQSIGECKEYRNDKDWFEYCGKVCGNFNFVEFSKYFQPNLDEFVRYDAFLKENVKRIDQEVKVDDQGVDEKADKVSKKTNKGLRVLEEAAEETEKKDAEKTEDPEKKEEGDKTEDPEKKEEGDKTDEAAKKEEKVPEITPAEKFANLSLFLLKEGSPIINMKPIYKDKGISLCDIGEAALITKKTLEIAKMKDLPPPPVEEKEEPVKEAEGEAVAMEVAKKEGGGEVKGVEALEAPEEPAVEKVMVFEIVVVFFLTIVFG